MRTWFVPHPGYESMEISQKGLCLPQGFPKPIKMDGHLRGNRRAICLLRAPQPPQSPSSKAKNAQWGLLPTTKVVGLRLTTAQVDIQNVAHQALAKVGLYCPPQNGGTSCEYATTKKQDCINLNN